MEILLYATCFFSLDAFSILFISSIIVSLSTIYLSMFLLELILCVTLPASYTLMTVFFPYQESVQLMLSLQIFSQAFCLSLFLLGTLQQVVHLILSQMSLNSPHLFLFFILFHSSDFHHSVFQFTYLFFSFIYSVFDYSKCIFHFSYYILQPWLFFIFYVH